MRERWSSSCTAAASSSRAAAGTRPTSREAESPPRKKDGANRKARRRPATASETRAKSQSRVQADAKTDAKSEAKGTTDDTFVGKRRAVHVELKRPRVTTMKRYIMAGLLVWVPLGITIYVMVWLVTTLDQTLLLIPEHLRPEALVGFHIPGLGVLLSFAILLATGFLAANFFGQRLIKIWESMLGRIPVVKSIYSSVKQVSDTVLSDQGTAFRKALLVEFPRPGCWTIAFLTGAPSDAVADHLRGEFVSVYVPTTPNPTGGYFVMVPRESTRELDMSVDDALKYIISMGVVAPRRRVPPIVAPKAAPKAPLAAPAGNPRN
jgi:uncharacterized membrane protein